MLQVKWFTPLIASGAACIIDWLGIIVCRDLAL